ncbi:hypothetical protein K503DRAFT_820209, partial [Rhizopogon vinicolor AM-OR11-026]
MQGNVTFSPTPSNAELCLSQFLLSNQKAIAPLIRFVNSTGGLKPTFGDVPPPTHSDK